MLSFITTKAFENSYNNSSAASPQKIFVLGASILNSQLSIRVKFLELDVLQSRWSLLKECSHVKKFSPSTKYGQILFCTGAQNFGANGSFAIQPDK